MKAIVYVLTFLWIVLSSFIAPSASSSFAQAPLAEAVYLPIDSMQQLENHPIEKKRFFKKNKNAPDGVKRKNRGNNYYGVILYSFLLLLVVLMIYLGIHFGHVLELVFGILLDLLAIVLGSIAIKRLFRNWFNKEKSRKNARGLRNLTYSGALFFFHGLLFLLLSSFTSIPLLIIAAIFAGIGIALFIAGVISKNRL